MKTENMGKVKSREGTHYNKRNNLRKDDKKFTVNDFTLASTGISEDDYKLFPSKSMQVQRILTRIKDFTGRPDITEDVRFRPLLIRILQKAISNDYGKENLSLMLNNSIKLDRCGDNGGEDEVWSMLNFIDTVISIPTDEQKPFQQESQEFQDIVSKIFTKIHADMRFLSAFVFDDEKKLELLKEYLEDIEDIDQSGFFESWRSEIRDINAEHSKQLRR